MPNKQIEKSKFTICEFIIEIMSLEWIKIKHHKYFNLFRSQYISLKFTTVQYLTLNSLRIIIFISKDISLLTNLVFTFNYTSQTSDPHCGLEILFFHSYALCYNEKISGLNRGP